MDEERKDTPTEDADDTIDAPKPPTVSRDRVIAELKEAYSKQLASFEGTPKSFLEERLREIQAERADSGAVSLEDMIELVLQIVPPLQQDPPKRHSDGTTDVNGDFVPPAFPRMTSQTGKLILI